MKTSLAQRIVRAFFALLLLGLGGCGGGSGGTDHASGGIGGTGIAVGTITALGSIVVNGVEYDTSAAAVFIGGENKGMGDPVVRAYLHVGKVVVVEGTVDNDETSGTATRVDFEASVAGPVESVDPDGGRLVVLEQVVLIDGETVLEGYVSADDIGLGDPVEVSGLVDSAGTIQATYLGRKPSPVEVEVKGVIQQLNIAAQVFRIHGLRVSCGAADTTGLPGGVPEEGLLVRVIGTVGPSGELEATRIQLARETGAVNADRMDVEGLVTEIVSSSEFTVGYQQVVRTDAETMFKGGEPADIALGVRIEVKGRLGNRVLEARKITFPRSL